MRKTVRYTLAGLVFWAGLFLAFRAAPPERPSFEQAWAQRVAVYCRTEAVFPRCTVDTPLNELLNPDIRAKRLRAEKARGLLPRRRDTNVLIWIRDK